LWVVWLPYPLGVVVSGRVRGFLATFVPLPATEDRCSVSAEVDGVSGGVSDCAADGPVAVACGPDGADVIPIFIVMGPLFTSWPGLTRPSTSLVRLVIQDVDARDKRGHDESEIVSIGITASPPRFRFRPRMSPHNSFEFLVS
jgi:hypothetical protein